MQRILGLDNCRREYDKDGLRARRLHLERISFRTRVVSEPYISSSTAEKTKPSLSDRTIKTKDRNLGL